MDLIRQQLEKSGGTIKIARPLQEKYLKFYREEELGQNDINLLLTTNEEGDLIARTYSFNYNYTKEDEGLKFCTETVLSLEDLKLFEEDLEIEEEEDDETLENLNLRLRSIIVASTFLFSFLEFYFIS